MGRTPHETTAIARRRQEVAELYIKGWFQTAIAEVSRGAQNRQVRGA